MTFADHHANPMKTDRHYPASYLKQETSREAERIRAHPAVEEITLPELIRRAADCGYEIDPSFCFNYVNNANSITYRARSIGWRHKASGMRFAHIAAPRDTLPEIWQSLQPAAARKIAGHKEYRLRQISLRYYARYTKAAYLHIADAILNSAR